ncbi:MAG: hypothetical protein EHM13_03150 [Acidobacteria bacterium]|nr:MAG: hypothetical protein EHM13_03150 [Acidobacteriota bacterium]
MTNHFLWRLVDVLVGLLFAGLLAPITLIALPGGRQGPWTVLATALVTIGIVMLLRPRVVGPGDSRT